MPLAMASCRFNIFVISPRKYADIFEKQTPMLSWTWKIYGIQYVKVDIRTNKPLNGHFRFRLSCSVSIQDWPHTRFSSVWSVLDGDNRTSGDSTLYKYDYYVFFTCRPSCFGVRWSANKYFIFLASQKCPASFTQMTIKPFSSTH